MTTFRYKAMSGLCFIRNFKFGIHLCIPLPTMRIIIRYGYKILFFREVHRNTDMVMKRTEDLRLAREPLMECCRECILTRPDLYCMSLPMEWLRAAPMCVFSIRWVSRCMLHPYLCRTTPAGLH